MTLVLLEFESQVVERPFWEKKTAARLWLLLQICKDRYILCAWWSNSQLPIYPPPTDFSVVRMRGPAAMAERLARPSPCDWPWSGVYKPLSQYHRPLRLIGSDGSAHKEIQNLALILSRGRSDRPSRTQGEKELVLCFWYSVICSID